MPPTPLSLSLTSPLRFVHLTSHPLILDLRPSLPLSSLQALELHDYQGRKSLAVSVVGTVVNKSISIPTADEVCRSPSVANSIFSHQKK